MLARPQNVLHSSSYNELCSFRQVEQIESVHMALKYMIIVESSSLLASPVVVALR